MATCLDPGNQRLRPDLLHQLKWKDNEGTMHQLDLYTVLSSVWDNVSDQLMINQYTRQSIESKNRGDPNKCIREIIEMWLRDEKSLNSNFPCTWNGICSLLKAVRLSTASEDLEAALLADVSSFNNNLSEKVIPTRCIGDKTFVQNSSKEFISPYLPEQIAGIKHRAELRDLRFPGLNLESLSVEEEQQLKETLRTESSVIAKKFSEILQNFYMFLFDQPDIVLYKIQVILSTILKLPTVYKSDQNIALPIKDVLTIQDLANIFNRYSSFFNYHLLENVFKKIDYQNGMKALEQYKIELLEYAKRRISHFPSGVGFQNCQNYVVVAIKLDDMYEGCDISHLLNFHQELCQLLKLSLGEFTLDGLKRGCIQIIFHLLIHLSEKIFPLSNYVMLSLSMLRCHNARIIKVICGEYVYELDNNLSDCRSDFGNISESEAESILKKSKKRNSYLTRFSEGNDSYTVSVIFLANNEDKVIHLKLSIDNENSSFCLESTNKNFHSLDELLKFYERNMINSEIQNLGSPCIQSKLPKKECHIITEGKDSEMSDNKMKDFNYGKEIPEHKSYFGNISESEAENILKKSKKRNSYLTRLSEGNDSYTVSVIFLANNEDKVIHLKLAIDNENSFSLEGTQNFFESLDELLKFYECNGLSSGIRNLGSPCVSQNSQRKDCHSISEKELMKLKSQRYEMSNHISYHGEQDTEEAERRLSIAQVQAQGQVNLCNWYLTRYSKTTESYVVSVLEYHNGNQKLVHIKLNIDKEKGHSLEGNMEIFRTLDELLHYYESNPLSHELRGLGIPVTPPDQSSGTYSTPSIHSNKAEGRNCANNGKELIEKLGKQREEHRQQLDEDRWVFKETIEQEGQTHKDYMDEKRREDEARVEREVDLARTLRQEPLPPRVFEKKKTECILL